MDERRVGASSNTTIGHNTSIDYSALVEEHSAGDGICATI
jgi:hypothetical protein